jgi:hypothetical protein
VRPGTRRKRGLAASDRRQPSLGRRLTTGPLCCAVLWRAAGLTRQYLLPMPSTRQKFEEPTFRPVLDPHSMVGCKQRVLWGVPGLCTPAMS